MEIYQNQTKQEKAKQKPEVWKLSNYGKEIYAFVFVVAHRF